MKGQIAVTLGLWMSASLMAAVCRADNPIIQTKFTADPAPLVYKNTVYLYTSHDEDDATSFKMRDWLCYTTTDMANWTDHGAVASLENFKWAAPAIFCVDEFTYNPNGTIPTLPWWTTTGPPQIGSLNPYHRTEAVTICWESGVKTEPCAEGGMNVYNIGNGSYIKVKGVNFGSGAKSFEARVASAADGGNIELRLDSPVGPLVGTCAVPSTGGWQTWTTQSCKVSGATGTHDLYLRFTGGSGSLFNFDWWQFHR